MFQLFDNVYVIKLISIVIFFLNKLAISKFKKPYLRFQKIIGLVLVCFIITPQHMIFASDEIKERQGNSKKRKTPPEKTFLDQWLEIPSKRPRDDASTPTQAGLSSTVIIPASISHIDSNNFSSTVNHSLDRTHTATNFNNLTSSSIGVANDADAMDIDEDAAHSAGSNSAIQSNESKVVSEEESRAAAEEELEKAEEALKNSSLNIYLMRKVEKPELIQLSSKKEQDEFGSFPWEYINETRRSLIFAPHKQDSFIDAQHFSKINPDEEIYVFQETRVSRSSWMEVISQQVDTYKKYEITRNPLFENLGSPEPKGTVIFIKKMIKGQERFFALVFGWTGRYLLNLDWCDPSFGKHYAYNLLSQNLTFRAQSFTEVSIDEKKLKKEQAKTNGRVEILRHIRTVIPKALTVTNGKEQVCSFAGAHIWVRAKLCFKTIGERCKNYLKFAEDEDYKKEYSHIDYFTPLENPDEINNIFLASFKNFDLELPLDIDRTSGLYALHKYDLSSSLSLKKNFPSLAPSYDDFTHLSEDLKTFIKGSQSIETVKKLKKLKIVAKDNNDFTLSIFKALQFITAQVELNGKTYWIEDGEIFEVHRDFIDQVNRKIDSRFWIKESSNPDDSSLCNLTSFTDTDLSSRNGIKVKSEAAYNKRIVKEYPKEFMLSDTENIRIKKDPNQHSKVEPCDLLSCQGDMIHLKRWTNSSSSVSYLVTQALSSASLLLKDKDFLEEYCTTVSQNEAFKNIPQLLREKKFRIVLAFIHKEEGIRPSGLAFNAKLELFRGLSELEKMGLEGIIISIKDDSSPKSSSEATHFPLNQVVKKSMTKQSQKSTSTSQKKKGSQNNSSDLMTQSQALDPSQISPIKEKQQSQVRSNSNSSSTLNSTLSINDPEAFEDIVGTENSSPGIDLLEKFEKFDYKNLKINLRNDIAGLQIQASPLNPIGNPEESYELDGKTFYRQNVSGKALKCFFNAVGLEHDSEITKLRNKYDNHIVRYMIANEIVSAAEAPDQLSEAVKVTINYNLYEAQRGALNSAQENFIVHNIETPEDETKLSSLHANWRKKDSNVLDELRERALKINAFNAFIDNHIGNENMMVALLDVTGEAGDNDKANYTSIDAIAYINDFGIKIYQPNNNGFLRLAHQFIPQNAAKIIYIYHSEVHFQALVPKGSD